MYMRASLIFSRIFTLQNHYFLQYFVGTSDTLSRKYMYIFRSQITSAYICNQCSFPFSMALYKRQYVNKTLTLRKSMYMRASGASELRIFFNFHILKLLFSQYFVGTSATLSVQMTFLSANMYRQISKCTDKTPKKHYGGGGGGGNCPLCSPPPIWLR